MHKWMVVLTLAMGVAACGGQRDPDEHVWKAQTDALEKAKQVEGELQRSADRTRKAIDAAGQAGSAD
jgi:outer membrane PBP1 activator LpoA protein